MFRASPQDFYPKKDNNESFDVGCIHFNVRKIKMRQYLTNILRCDTSSDNMKAKIDYWLYSFEIFHKKYIIMPTKSYNYLFHLESRFIPVISLPGFINQENETRIYFNATIQLLYRDVLFRKLILSIDCCTMIICLDKNNKTISHHY